MPSPPPDAAPYQSLSDAYRSTVHQLRAAGIASPELDGRLLICAAAELRHEAFVADPRRPLDAREMARLKSLLSRRLAREPVSRILGRREFWGREFLLSPATLDPRPDSETLVDAVLRLAPERPPRGRGLTILDLGTGSGALLVTLLAELHGALGLGTDISLAALGTARQNARRLGVSPRAGFVAASWLDGLKGEFDIVVANPPYVRHGEIAGLEPEVAHYDPHAALDGGSDGLDAYRRIVGGLGDVLAGGGLLALEVGQGQAASVAALIAKSGLARTAEDPKCWPDLAGVIRCVTQRISPQKGVGNSDCSG